MAVFCGQVRNVFTQCIIASSYSHAKAQRYANFLLMYCSLLAKVLRDTLRLCVIQNYVLIL